MHPTDPHPHELERWESEGGKAPPDDKTHFVPDPLMQATVQRLIREQNVKHTSSQKVPLSVLAVSTVLTVTGLAASNYSLTWGGIIGVAIGVALVGWTYWKQR